jgi:hypothetical protein
VTRKMFWHSPHALKVLFSPEHGFFVWTPLAALAIAGLVLLTLRSRRQGEDSPDRRRIAACMLLMAGLQVYVSGAVDSWSVAGAFGHRRFVAVTVLLVVGLAAAWNWTAAHGARRWAVSVIVLVCVYWNLALIALFGTRMMDRQRIELGRNAYDAFVTLPRMAPALAWRYFRERDSFYQPRTAADVR